VFTSSDQNSDDTSPPKHDLCDFETSLRIQIRHGSDNEREYCISNKKTLFELFFNSSKRSTAPSAPLLTLAMLGSENRRIIRKDECVLLAFGTPRRALSQRKKKGKKIALFKPGPRLHVVLASAPTMGREATRCFPLQTSSSTTYVCVLLSLLISLIPYPWRPCQPPLPTAAPQLRCDLLPRPK